MGGLTSAVHWWEESQMRVLVLTSLVVQFLLIIFTFLRTRAIPWWIRFPMWLAYLGGDAIAIYALATLFNRHKEQDQGGYGGSSSNTLLEVVWAPVLLIHLGGSNIAAYNIEDNELWARHLLTAVSQVTVAIYVFCKSWPQGGDKRLLKAAILLFVTGVLKCFAKPWALKKASIKSLVSSSPDDRRKTKQKEARSTRLLDKYVQRRAKASVREQKDEGKQDEGEMDTFERYVKGATDFVREQNDAGEALQVHPRAPVEDSDHRPSQQGDDISSSQDLRLNQILHGEAYKLFVDLSSPLPLRLSLFRCFWTLSEERVEKAVHREKAYVCVRQGLASAFTLLYTKAKVSFLAIIFMKKEPDSLRGEEMNFFVSYFVSALRGILPWAAISLFHQSHRSEAYNGIDVKITYALFCCTAMLEVYSQYSFNPMDEHQWPEMVAQYNLIGYYACSKNHSNMMWIARNSGCKDFVDQHLCVESCFSSGTIAKLVLRYLKAGWMKKIHDSVSYLKFNDNRGQWALESYEEELGWSIEGPFDKTVLLWHIATDLCFFLRTPSGEQPTQKAVQCRQMSNYMVYLLFVNPEMLLPGTRRNLFNTAYDDLKDILGDNKPSLCKKLWDILTDYRQNLYGRVRNAMKELKDIFGDNRRNPISRSQWNPDELVNEEGTIQRVVSSILEMSTQASQGLESKQGPEEDSKPNFITDAYALAQGLLALGDEKMWKVIQRVWVEMLCFSSSRCRGYLHAKALGSGGEFLSYVWLLQFYMGMETFTERMERGRVVLRSHEGNNSAAQGPQASATHNGSGTASSSTWKNRGRTTTPSPSHLDTSVSPSNDDIRISMD